MTFPVIADTNSSEVGAGTNHTVNLPANISNGDLLLIFFATDGDNTITNWNGFTELVSESNGTANFFAIGYKNASGSEGGTIDITTSVSEPSSHVTYRITGWDSGQIPQASTVAEASSNTPNPTILTPTGGAKDYLWILAAGWDRNRTISAWNANFTLDRLYISGGGSGDCSVGISARNENVASKDPGSITINTADTWCAWTVAVHPITATYSLTGITKDNSGSVLGSCECYLVKDNLDDTYTFIAYQLSNGSGVYNFTGITDNDANYQVISWKDGTPVMDCTDHVLQPVVE